MICAPQHWAAFRSPLLPYAQLISAESFPSLGKIFFLLKFKTFYLCLFQVHCSVRDETMPTCAQVYTSTESYLFVRLMRLGLDFVSIGRQ